MFALHRVANQARLKTEIDNSSKEDKRDLFLEEILESPIKRRFFQ